MKSKKRVFIDMDGVLCEYKPNASLADMEQDGYFRNLLPRSIMLEAVKYLVDLAESEVYILSSVLQKREKEATVEKNEWLDEYLPAIDTGHRLFPLCGTNKVDAVDSFSEKDVLCDDYSNNLRNWYDAGGIAIKILNEVNGQKMTFVSGPRVRISHKDELAKVIAPL